MPTDEMRDAGNVHVRNRSVLYDAWKSMLAASPTPAAQSAGQEAVAWAVYSGIGEMRKHSVHSEKATAVEVASSIKSNTEVRPLYAAPVNGGERAADAPQADVNIAKKRDDDPTHEVLRQIARDVRNTAGGPCDEPQPFDYVLGGWRAACTALTSPAKVGGEYGDAYQGAREDLAIWKKRALEAEELNRRFIAEVNGPTHMGEPATNLHRLMNDPFVAAKAWRALIRPHNSPNNVSERELFMAWQIRENGWDHQDFAIADGRYQRVAIQDDWHVWQARAALSADGGDREDAELYRFLRDQADPDDGPFVMDASGNDLGTGEKLDAALRAAIAAKAKGDA
ncbi:hypothetical protein [Pandoraea bronchicola]|uniref:hypothetical protein n=1 Tax=Pandoraea bronchicola TaxID=2508287 RepID=UPI001581F135|nr:hypothetical protein [Pandoraea bronchicola]